MADPVAVAPGASVDGVKATLLKLSFVSVIVTFVSVTLPVFVAVNVYVITLPAFNPVAELDVFTNPIFGSCVNGVTVGLLFALLLLSDTSVTAGPEGGMPDTVAVFVILPASMSACVIV